MSRFRLLDLDHDSPLAVGLILATALVFQRPLRLAINSVAAVEQQYQVDLLPALAMLCVIFMAHQYRKRRESRAVAAAADAAAHIERNRVSELRELVEIGHALANALEIKEIEQALWRCLPASLKPQRLSIALRTREGWRLLVHDADGDPGGVRAEALAEKAAAHFDARSDGLPEPAVIDGSLCLPVCAGRAVIGAAMLPETSETGDPHLQQALASVLAFVGIAVRNVQLLADSRDHSVRDSLTRWFNRGHAIEMLRNDLRRAARTGAGPAVIMFDLDGFKTMNDTLGHLQGDATLQAVARTIDALVRSSDLRCRYGGDEFLLVLPETPLAGAAQVAEHLRRAINALDLATGRDGERLTCSFGVTTARDGELEPEHVIGRADAALYKAKRAGRNRVAIDDTAAPSAVPSKPALRLVSAGGA